MVAKAPQPTSGWDEAVSHAKRVQGGFDTNIPLPGTPQLRGLTETQQAMFLFQALQFLGDKVLHLLNIHSPSSLEERHFLHTGPPTNPPLVAIIAPFLAYAHHTGPAGSVPSDSGDRTHWRSAHCGFR